MQCGTNPYCGRLGLSRKLIIGLTGGIGSGKSTVARLLGEFGAAVIDSDALSRMQLAHPEVIDELRRWWGDSVITESESGPDVNRRRVSEIVFDDPAQRKKLERLIHPRIEKERHRLVQQYANDNNVKLIVFDSPLLLEAGLGTECDAVVYVHADDDVRRQRVTKDRGWTESEWRKREKSQMALDKKQATSDYMVVNNSSDTTQLRASVFELFCKLTDSNESTQ